MSWQDKLKRKPKKVSNSFMIRVPKELAEWIASWCEQYNTSGNQVVVAILKEHYERDTRKRLK